MIGLKVTYILMTKVGFNLHIFLRLITPIYKGQKKNEKIKKKGSFLFRTLVLE